MLTRLSGSVALAATLCTVWGADTIQLKDQASITGTVIADKNDQVAVDVGYTILMVPRSAITKIVADKK
jgi:hypothetical protein